MLAKTPRARTALAASFAAREVRKRYLAIVAGRVAAERGECDAPVGGKPAHTAWRVARRDASRAHGTVTTLELWPTTGRKHQLRRHCAAMGHPIVGDTQHRSRIACASSTPPPCGRDDDSGDDGSSHRATERPGLMLFAAALELPHPVTHEPIAVEAEEPLAFAEFRAAQRPGSTACAAVGVADGTTVPHGLAGSSAAIT